MRKKLHTEYTKEDRTVGIAIDDCLAEDPKFKTQSFTQLFSPDLST